RIHVDVRARRPRIGRRLGRGAQAAGGRLVAAGHVAAVVARAAVQLVGAGAPRDLVVTGAAIEAIRVPGAPDRVVEGGAEDVLDARQGLVAVGGHRRPPCEVQVDAA